MVNLETLVLRWQVIPWEWLVLVGVLGASVGSFLNVVIHRLPQRLSVVAPRSQCPACEVPIAWYQNIPLVSYLMLLGRCATCHVRIPVSYWCVEAATTVLFIAIFVLEGLSWVAVIQVMGGALLLAAAEIDRRYRIVPNRLVIAGLVVGGGYLIVLGWNEGAQHMAAALTATGLLLSVRWVGWRLTGRIGIGMGDVKLVAVLGLFVGWSVLWVLYLAIVFAAVFGVAGVLLKRIKRTARLPFVPFLAVATVVQGVVVPWPWFWVL